MEGVRCMGEVKTRVREIHPKDRDAYVEMWSDFTSVKPSEPGDPAMGAVNFVRMMKPDNPMRGIVIVNDNDSAQGFVCFLAFPFTWSKKNVCYLQDIYVQRSCRGLGYGRLLIEHLVEIAKTEGWYKIFWMTERDNVVAQHLYDRIAQKMDYVRYDLVVGSP
jgi:ribosomal protein S18 acetylase RimI-like enzyme